MITPFKHCRSTRKRVLYKDVNIKVYSGNIYGVIGINPEREINTASCHNRRFGTQQGNHYVREQENVCRYWSRTTLRDEFKVMDTVLMGNEPLWRIWRSARSFTLNLEMTEEDGNRAAGTWTEVCRNEWLGSRKRSCPVVTTPGVREDAHQKRVRRTVEYGKGA